MDAFFQRPAGGGSCGYDWLLNFRQMKPSVQRHLKMVYLTLCSSLVASAVGVYLHNLFNVGGIITMLGCLLSTQILMYMSPCQKRKRLGFLMGTAVFEGASIGRFFEFLDFDPRIILIGFVWTSLTFAFFSGAAMVVKRREFLFRCGLHSAWFLFSCLRTTSFIFGPSAAMLKFEIYLRLLIFLGYIVLHTQEIIEKTHHGDLDYVKHAFTLFNDFILCLVRILIIMSKNSAEKRRANGVSKHAYESCSS